jgi:hypothetical protein
VLTTFILLLVLFLLQGSFTGSVGSGSSQGSSKYSHGGSSRHTFRSGQSSNQTQKRAQQAALGKGMTDNGLSLIVRAIGSALVDCSLNYFESQLLRGGPSSDGTTVLTFVRLSIFETKEVGMPLRGTLCIDTLVFIVPSSCFSYLYYFETINRSTKALPCLTCPGPPASPAMALTLPSHRTNNPPPHRRCLRQGARVGVRSTRSQAPEATAEARIRPCRKAAVPAPAAATAGKIL